MKTSRVFVCVFFSLARVIAPSHSHSHTVSLYVSFSFLWLRSIVYLCLSFMWEIWCTAFNKPHFFLLFRSIVVFLTFALSRSISFISPVSFYLEFDALSEIWQWNLSPIIENLVHWMSDCVYRLFNGNFFIVWHEKPTIWTWMTVWPSILLKPLCLFYHTKAPLYIEQHIANAIVSMVHFFITVT